MAADRRQRGLVVRESFHYGDSTQPLDPEVIEAERLHLSEITGCDIRYLHYDRMAVEDPMYCHFRFLEEVARLRPSFVWYHPLLFTYLIHRNIRPEILYAARALYGSKLVFSFADLAYTTFTAYFSGYAAIGDVSASWDGNGWRMAALVPGKPVLDLAAPRDERVFRDLGLARDVNVCFAGSLGRYPDRRDMLARLKDLGIDVVSDGGDEHRYMTIEGYVGLLNRSKISLNFSQTPEGVHQMKGRVIESMLCGALVLESENDVTPRYFEPYRHYVPFTDAGDLVAKVRRYLADDDARQEILSAAKAHVIRHHSERIWWRHILNELDRLQAEERLRPASPVRPA